MHVSTRKHRTLSRLIGMLSADHASSRDLRTAIGPSLLELLDADFYASYVWNAQTRTFELGLGINIDDAFTQLAALRHAASAELAHNAHGRTRH